ncbi:sulfotransferase [Oscillatoriales cyanobacterium LEGE 11467]|uniref:Sulfotransferase n=1 Tax=Zarconia navalis LEGE 11467 TaxID=1828826 RepID=A0A928ZA37_9CYAN|nr:sulfotransferase [Zarconia navalis]MBE9042414.1 sulfotransferase [Zarconia navalis LEGE 11467]
MSKHQLLCVTGLPRSGSTLLCQLLAEHPDIFCDGMSSPLLGALQTLRGHLSDSEFWLAQLDGGFETPYTKLQRSCQAFAAAWWDETDCPVVVDKHRGWLNQIELALELDPNVRMLVCVRELGQIFSSIEAQHRKTVWLDFPDDLANLSPCARAEALFAPKGVVGGPLRAIQSVQDRSPDEQSRLFFVVFEHLTTEPIVVMKDLYEWLGVAPHKLDPQNLTVRPHEADSYYRFKYRHATYDKITPPQGHPISSRIDGELKDSYSWFYELFYPGLLDRLATT